MTHMTLTRKIKLCRSPKNTDFSKSSGRIRIRIFSASNSKSDPDRHRHEADPQHRNNVDNFVVTTYSHFPGKHATLAHTIHAVPSKVRKDKQQRTAGVQKLKRKKQTENPMYSAVLPVTVHMKHVAGPKHLKGSGSRNLEKFGSGFRG